MHPPTLELQPSHCGRRRRKRIERAEDVVFKAGARQLAGAHRSTGLRLLLAYDDLEPAFGHHYDMAKDEEVIVQIMGPGPVKTTQIENNGAASGDRSSGAGRGGRN